MNIQEREQLSEFLRQLSDVKLTEKDKEAEALIADAVRHQPDAAYLLIQRCLIQDNALQAAQSQIAELRQQIKQGDALATNGGFLGNNPWAPANNSSDAVPGAANYQVPSSQPNPADAAFMRAAPQAQQGAGLGSSFLGNIAATAAGVVAGSFLYQGIGNLLGHHASPNSWPQNSHAIQPTEQTVVNNYYGDEDHSARHEVGDHFMAVNDGDGLLDDSDFDSDWI
ncbi:MAG: DUF2076 domain-containing protein [Gammaproteobacteria bacterium]